MRRRGPWVSETRPIVPVISIMNDVVVSIFGCEANWRPHTAHAAPTAAQLEYTSQSKGRPSEMKWKPPR